MRKHLISLYKSNSKWIQFLTKNLEVRYLFSATFLRCWVVKYGAKVRSRMGVVKKTGLLMDKKTESMKQFSFFISFNIFFCHHSEVRKKLHCCVYFWLKWKYTTIEWLSAPTRNYGLGDGEINLRNIKKHFIWIKLGWQWKDY